MRRVREPATVSRVGRHNALLDDDYIIKITGTINPIALNGSAIMLHSATSSLCTSGNINRKSDGYCSAYKSEFIARKNSGVWHFNNMRLCEAAVINDKVVHST